MPNMYIHGEDSDPAKKCDMSDAPGEKLLKDPGKSNSIPESADRDKAPALKQSGKME